MDAFLAVHTHLPGTHSCPGAVLSRLTSSVLIVLYRFIHTQMAATYPELMAHHRKLAEVKGIKQYLVSERRFAKVNNNNLG